MMTSISLFSSYFSCLWCLVFGLLFYLNFKKSKNEKKHNGNYLLNAIFYFLSLKFRRKQKNSIFILDPPSPGLSLPVFGHMYSLIKHANHPWQGFDLLRKKYGDIVYLRLGDYNFLLVSSVKYIKEVLITKGDLFANRPHFERYKSVFGGDQENALALCDWSELQKQRRNMAQASIIPRYGTKLFENLDQCINEEILVLNEKLTNDQRNVIKLTKLDILVSVFNIFSDYLCSQR